MQIKTIKNFCIIAHIDHGKSTLSDRIIELTHSVSERDMQDQFLDNMELEKERGITIKLQTLRMYYTADDSEEYELNLIDTPGHADFNYEVSRSIAACEGAVLVVDATQGVQAQTIANLKLAMESNLCIIPVINKIDMPNANPEKVKKELISLNVPNAMDALLVSAKTGVGVHELLEKIVHLVPSPSGKSTEPLQALVFDSHYDLYKGVVLHVKIVNGTITAEDNLLLFSSKRKFAPMEIGFFTPEMKIATELSAGMVGYIATGLKEASILRPGDTIVNAGFDTHPLAGYEAANQVVFAGIYPLDSADENRLKDAMYKLSLNDSSISFEEEHSAALGYGYRCGFMGVLHMEIVKERLEREYDIKLLTTAPSVLYKIFLKSGEKIYVRNPKDFPDFQYVDCIFEPVMRTTIIMPVDNIGDVMSLCSEKKGEYIATEYLSEESVEITYRIPASQIVYGFYDRLKSITHGYSSVNYAEDGYEEADLVKLDIFLNDDIVDAFSCVVYRDEAYDIGRKVVEKMKYVIPRKLYPMPVQAVVEHKTIAREDIPPLRKSVTGKGFSGSMSKKKKAAKNIVQNSNRQRKYGKADIPQEALLAILNIVA